LTCGPPPLAGLTRFLSAGSNAKQLTFARFLRIMRLLRILRSFRVLQRAMSPLKRQVLALALILTSMLFM
jgi:hypothetical protein